MEKQAKKRSKLWLIVLAAIVLIGAIAGVCIAFFSGGGTADTPPAAAYTIYWNVDRLAYIDAESGLNNRTANSGGYFPITLSFNGEQKEFLAADKPLVAQMDQMEMFGIVQNENGIIIDVLEIEEFTGGFVAERFYVESVTEDSFTANSSKTLKGESVTYSLENVKVYSVVGEGFLVGMPTALRQNDRIIGVIDTAGNLTHVYVVETSGPTTTHYCDHCAMEVEWIGWTDAESLPKVTGHYYLTTDVQLKAQASIQEEQAIILDLNGKTATGAEGKRVYSLHNEGAYLAVMDYSTERTGKLAAWGQGAHAQGTVVWVRYGLFELFSGTLDASRVSNDMAGVAVYVNKERAMNMYGGTIIGGTSTVYTNPNTGKKSGAYAGSIYCEGTLTISGGVIRDGKTVAYQDPADGKYKRGAAGNVYISTAGTLNMTGGSILNGEAEGDGGNLYVDGIATISGDVTISGGKVTKEGKRGGNIIVGSKGTLCMEGGSVTDGYSVGSGGNIYSSGNTQWIGVTITGGTSENTDINNISVYNNTCLLHDCEVNGDVYVAKNGQLTLSGATTIPKGENYGLKIINEVLIDPTGLTDGAKIDVSASGFFTDKTNAGAAKYFDLECEGSVFYTQGKLFAGKMYCLCGGKDSHESYCDGTKLLWKAWISEETMPTSEGNYYLTTNVKLEKRATVGKAGGTAADARNVVWDLNGYTVTGAKDARLAFVTGHSTLSICDSGEKGTGKLVATGTQTENGHTVFGGSNTVINIYGGTITGGKVEAILKTTTNKDGTQTTKAANGQGGNLYTYGVLNMYGGTITGGVAKAYYDKDGNKYSYGQGGNVALPSQGQFNFYGGTISGGTADQNGGNLYTAAPVTMYDGAVITGGSVALESKTGGNVYLTGTCTFDMQGGSIAKGIATSNGGNVMSYGKFNLSGGSVTDGTARNLGGNICVGATGAAAISGGTVSGGFAKSGTDAQGNAVLETTAASANIIAMKDSTFAITGGHITGGVRVLDGCVLTLGGSPVIDGISLGGNTQATIDGTLGENAKIVLTKDKNGYFAITQEGTNADKFTVQEGLAVEFDQQAGMLQILQGAVVSDHNHCICAGGAAELHTCESEGFLPWGDAESEKTGLPTSGSYYLTSDITLSDPGSGTGICKIEDSLSLCLNGYTVTTSADCARRMFHVSGGSFSVTDCSAEETGKIAAGYAAYTAEGGLMLVGSNSEFSLYGGTLSGTNLVEAGKNGGTLRSYGTINIYGGTVTGGTAVNGGNIAAGGPLNIYGGTIAGGIATGNGGNIWISSGSAAILIGGGEITFGTAAKGGGLYVNGSVALTGDVHITENTGSNMFVPEGKSVTIDGTLGETASIGVTANGSFAATTDAANARRFTADDGESQVIFADNALSVTAAGTEVPEGHSHCICAGNENHTECASVEWEPISDKVGSLNSGHYYLEGPVELTGSITVGSGKDIYICLNGNTMTAKDGQRAFLVNGGQLHIANCMGTGKLTGNAATASANLNGGVIFIMKGTLELFGGTVESLNTEPDNTQYGGTIRVGNNASNVGTFRMYGGTVTGGTAQKGGNIYICSGSFEMLGGLVTGGTAETAGHNLFIQNTQDASAKLSGGTIEGGVWLDGASGSLTLSGDISITGAQEAYNLYLVENALVQIDGILEPEACIGVTLKNGLGKFATVDDSKLDETQKESLAQNMARFIPDAANQIVAYDDLELSLVEHSHCTCAATGDTHQSGCKADVNWQVWRGDEEAFAAGGSFVLGYDMTLTEMFTLESTEDKPLVIDLCLNGHTLTGAEGTRLFNIKSYCTLNICDCGIDGSIVANNAGKVSVGGVMQVNGNATVNQYGGTVTGGNTTSNGGNIVMYSTSVYNLYGGRIVNGTSGNIGGNLNIGSGSVFTMTGGEISGGTAKTANANSNNIGMTSAGEINLSGGYIQGGIRATKGKINLSGTIRITDGTVSNLSVNGDGIIKIVGTLTGEKQVGITRGKAAAFATEVNEDVSAYFFSDDSAYTVTYDRAGSRLMLSEA